MSQISTDRSGRMQGGHFASRRAFCVWLDLQEALEECFILAQNLSHLEPASLGTFKDRKDSPV